MITQQEIRTLMVYDAVTGEAAWIRGKWKGHKVGTLLPSGYVQVRIKGRSYQLHRVIWLWMTGEWPPTQVDHRDTDRANNRWDNLRLATHTQNQWNTQTRSDNSSGYKGVTRPRGRTKWHAYINENGRRKFLGSYPTAEEANQAAIAARQVAHGEFAR